MWKIWQKLNKVAGGDKWGFVMNFQYFLFFAAVILFVFLQLLKANTQQTVTASDEYCEMVDLWYRTGGTDKEQGELGWPDYRGIYEKACKG